MPQAKMLKITILLVSCFLFLSPSPVFAHTGNFQIRMTKNGFSPAFLTIIQGDTVQFINDGAEAHWPASDIHPTHQIYPEFDPKKGVAPGKSWSFSFDRAGSWRMHDHLFPENVGRITVTKDPNYVNPKAQTAKLSVKDQIQSKLDDLKIALLQEYYKIFPQQLDKVLAGVNMHSLAANNEDLKIRYYLKLLGSKKVMDKLIADSGGGSIVDCHQEAHRIGRIAFGLYGAEVFQEGNFDCHSGFIHGAMEMFLQQKGTDNLAANIENLCNAFPTSYGNFECLHGVGHGVMAYVNYDMPTGLQTCQQLSTGFEQSSCFGGVFMENIVTAEGNGAGSAHVTKWVSSDPHFPCNAVSLDPNVQVQCYLMQTSRMLDISGYNFDFVTQNCLSAPANMVTTCFQSEGRDAAGQTLRDPVKILGICGKVPLAYYSNCITGSLNVIIEFWAQNMADKPHQLCKMITNSDAKKNCYSLLASRLAGIYGKDSASISKSCAYFEPDYQSLCHSLSHV